MLPRERMIAALEHREPDRIPWGEHWINHNVYEDFLGRPSLLHAGFRTTRAYWDGRRDEVVASHKRDLVDLTNALELDIIAVETVAPRDHRPQPWRQVDAETYCDEHGDLYRVSVSTGNLMFYQRGDSEYVPPTLESVQRDIDQLDDQPLDDPADSKFEVVRHIVQTMKGTHYIMLLCGDLEWPTFGRTTEERWMNLVRQPAICRKLGELWGKRMVRDVEVFAQLGVDAIMPCGDLGSNTSLMASPRIYREMVYPWHQAHAMAAHQHGLKILKHCCGHVMPIIDDLADVYDAYESIQATAGMDIGQLKPRVGGRLCLWGGIWHEHILAGTPADIRNDARYAFATAGPGGGFIMGSTHSLATGAKPENVLEMKRCRDEWGGYPLMPERWK
jgi:uroporphyrinogen decarboxylase